MPSPSHETLQDAPFLGEHPNPCISRRYGRLGRPASDFERHRSPPSSNLDETLFDMLPVNNVHPRNSSAVLGHQSSATANTDLPTNSQSLQLDPDTPLQACEHSTTSCQHRVGGFEIPYTSTLPPSTPNEQEQLPTSIPNAPTCRPAINTVDLLLATSPNGYSKDLNKDADTPSILSSAWSTTPFVPSSLSPVSTTLVTTTTTPSIRNPPSCASKSIPFHQIQLQDWLNSTENSEITFAERLQK